jgi:hypothetical protein
MIDETQLLLNVPGAHIPLCASQDIQSFEHSHSESEQNFADRGGLFAFITGTEKSIRRIVVVVGKIICISIRGIFNSDVSVRPLVNS